MSFNSFPLSPELLDGLSAMGFDNPTPIQKEAIPIILDNHDLVGCAQTGTGKTGAYVIPLIQKFSGSEGKHIRCLVLVPTRELALQIDQQIDGFGYFTGVASAPIYGGGQGSDFDIQKKAIESGADIIIATPGRLLAHHNLGYLDLSKVETVVLDEADRMLDMGFIGDIMKIIGYMPKEKQTLLFSATMAPMIRKLADQILINPEQINLAIAKPAAGINQQAYMVYDGHKITLLERLITQSEVRNMLIFASKKTSVDDIVRSLKKLNLNARSMHSGKSQEERNETLRDFKAGRFNIMVATDILSRGIDIDDLSHVLNYDIPDDPADYVHRIGRTARAEKTGAAISFINLKDQNKIANIERLIEREIPKSPTPEDIGESPEYAPTRKSGGRGGRSRHGKSGGKRRFNNKGRKRHGNNNSNQQNQGNRDGQKGGGGGNRKNRNKRRRPGGGGSNSGNPSQGPTNQ